MKEKTDFIFKVGAGIESVWKSQRCQKDKALSPVTGSRAFMDFSRLPSPQRVHLCVQNINLCQWITSGGQTVGEPS